MPIQPSKAVLDFAAPESDEDRSRLIAQAGRVFINDLSAAGVGDARTHLVLIGMMFEHITQQEKTISALDPFAQPPAIDLRPTPWDHGGRSPSIMDPAHHLPPGYNPLARIGGFVAKAKFDPDQYLNEISHDDPVLRVNMQDIPAEMQTHDGGATLVGRATSEMTRG